MLVLNVTSSLCYGFFNGLLFSRIFLKSQESYPKVLSLLIASNFSVRFCLIASGAALMLSVWKVRHFFKSRNATDYINTEMLLRHGISFGLYLVGSVVAAIFLSLYNLDRSNAKREKSLPWVLIANYLI